MTDRQQQKREADKKRAAKYAWRKWYQTAEWVLLRRRRLAEEPLCRMCAAIGKTVAATVVDHIKPHRGILKLFFDFANTQSLCAHCHNSLKQAYEKSRNVPVGVDGWPIEGE